jgi:hypothetical protein
MWRRANKKRVLLLSRLSFDVRSTKKMLVRIKLMIELSAKVNLGGLGFESLTNILITAKKLILLIISLIHYVKTFSEREATLKFLGSIDPASPSSRIVLIFIWHCSPTS